MRWWCAKEGKGSYSNAERAVLKRELLINVELKAGRVGAKTIIELKGADGGVRGGAGREEEGTFQPL